MVFRLSYLLRSAFLVVSVLIPLTVMAQSPVPLAPERLRLVTLDAPTPTPTPFLPSDITIDFSGPLAQNSAVESFRTKNIAVKSNGYAGDPSILADGTVNLGLAHYWSLSGDLKDRGAASNDATAGASTDFRTNGPLGTASQYLAFDGAQVLRASAISLNTQQMVQAGVSVGMWYRREQDKAARLFTQRWDSIGINLTASGIPQCEIRSLKDQFYFATSDSPTPKGEWTHLLCTYRPSTRSLELYIDAKRVAQQTIPSTFESFYFFNSMGIGNDPADPANPDSAFVGGLAQVGVWNRDLAEEEIVALQKRKTDLKPDTLTIVSRRIALPDSAPFYDATFQPSSVGTGILYFVSLGGADWVTIKAGQTLRQVFPDHEGGFYGFRLKASFIGNGILTQAKFSFDTKTKLPTPPGTAIGLNASGYCYYCNGVILKDLMAQAATRTGSSLTVIQGNTKDLPAGDYTFSFKGGGASVGVALDVPFEKRQGFNSAGTYKVTYHGVPAGSEPQGFYYFVLSEDPNDPVRDVHLMQPGFTDSKDDYEDHPFTKVFLDSNHGSSVIRFMDALGTNGSTLQNWSDRPLPGTSMDKGPPIELLIKLANEAQVDPWFNVPHMATDDYIHNFARLIKSQLDPKLKVYVEYSNEVWNWGFGQTYWVYSWGLGVGLTHPEAVVKKSLNAISIFREELGNDRVVGVIGGWSAGWNQQLMDAVNSRSVNPDNIRPDAIATAPYIGYDMAPLFSNEYTTVDDAIDMLSLRLSELRANLRSQKELSIKENIPIIGYEAGQHLTGAGGYENDLWNAQHLMRANKHPRMRDIYNDYYRIWQEELGTPVAAYSHFGTFSKWGSWGAFEYFTDKMGDKPKWMSLRRSMDLFNAKKTGLNPVCGNGVLEAGEDCDGTAMDMNLSACSDYSLQYVAGSLACSSDCRFSTNMCTKRSCTIEQVSFDNDDWQGKAKVGDSIKLLAMSTQGGNCAGKSVMMNIYYAPENQAKKLIAAVPASFYDDQIARTSWTVTLPNPAPGDTSAMPYTMEAVIDGNVTQMQSNWTMTK